MWQSSMLATSPSLIYSLKLLQPAKLNTYLWLFPLAEKSWIIKNRFAQMCHQNVTQVKILYQISGKFSRNI